MSKTGGFLYGNVWISEIINGRRKLVLRKIQRVEVDIFKYDIVYSVIYRKIVPCCGVYGPSVQIELVFGHEIFYYFNSVYLKGNELRFHSLVKNKNIPDERSHA
jgi:hypothetical protein